MPCLLSPSRETAVRPSLERAGQGVVTMLALAEAAAEVPRSDFWRSAESTQVSMLGEDEVSPLAVVFILLMRQGSVSPLQAWATRFDAIIGTAVNTQAIINQRFDEIQTSWRLKRTKAYSFVPRKTLPLSRFKSGRIHDDIPDPARDLAFLGLQHAHRRILVWGQSFGAYAQVYALCLSALYA